MTTNITNIKKFLIIALALVLLTVSVLILGRVFFAPPKTVIIDNWEYSVDETYLMFGHLKDDSDLKNIKYMVNVKSLDIRGDFEFTNMTPFKTLTKIEELKISHTGVVNIDALSNMKKLKILCINKCYIENIKPLKKLYNLEELDLVFLDELTDIEPLKNLTNLKKLSLNAVSITNINVLVNLTNLEYLDLYKIQIDNIDALIKLINLKELYLNNNQLSDIETLCGLGKIGILGISDTQIKNVNALSGLNSLRVLYLEYNQIIDISSLGELTNLTALYLYGNQITDVSPLFELTNLERLDLRGNPLNEEQIAELRAALPDCAIRW